MMISSFMKTVSVPVFVSVPELKNTHQLSTVPTSDDKTREAHSKTVNLVNLCRNYTGVNRQP